MLFYIDGKQFLGGSEKFDLVILDIDLPDIDGITISKQIVSRTRYIIFLTSMEDRMQDAFGQNVIGYIFKSSSRESIISKLKELLDIVQEERILLRSELGEISLNVAQIQEAVLEQRKLYRLNIQLGDFQQKSPIFCGFTDRSIRRIDEVISHPFAFIYCSRVFKDIFIPDVPDKEIVNMF